MIGTFLRASGSSFRNRVVHRLRRLKQPRYLFSTLIGLAYFTWLIVGNMGGELKVDGSRIPIVGEIVLVALSVIVLVVLLGAWALPGSAAGVTFTEAEIQFLFPAPLTRSQLLLYKVTRSQPAILFGAVMVRIFLVRGGHFVGVWIALVVLDLYLLMAAFGRARLRQFGIGFPARIAIVAVLLAGSSFVTWQALHGIDGERVVTLLRAHQMSEAASIIGGAIFHGIAGALFFVPALFAKPAVANGLPDFLRSSAVLVAVGFVCFRVATRFDVSFEDASIEASKKKAEKLTRQRNWQKGQTVIFRRAPALFRLGENGPPEVAIIWKNMIAAGRITLPIVALVLGIIAIVVGLTAVGGTSEKAISAAASLSFALLVALVFAGPLMIRNDLRLEVDRLDVLRLLPLSGARLVATELVAPTAIVLVLQMGLLAAALVLNGMVLDHERWLKFALWTPALLVVAIPVNVVQLLFQNGIVVLLPAWARMTKDQSRGAEGIGRGILLMLGHMLFFVVGLLPAGLTFVVGFWLAGFIFEYGPAAGTIAAVPASMVLWMEILFMIRFLGAQFEELDVANDLEPWEE